MSSGTLVVNKGVLLLPKGFGLNGTNCLHKFALANRIFV